MFSTQLLAQVTHDETLNMAKYVNMFDMWIVKQMRYSTNQQTNPRTQPLIDVHCRTLKDNFLLGRVSSEDKQRVCTPEMR